MWFWSESPDAKQGGEMTKKPKIFWRGDEFIKPQSYSLMWSAGYYVCAVYHLNFSPFSFSCESYFWLQMSQFDEKYVRTVVVDVVCVIFRVISYKKPEKKNGLEVN